jgi:hypothetical protein
MATTVSHDSVEDLELCGERFVAGDVVPVWRHANRDEHHIRSVLEIERGAAYDVMQRMLRRLTGGPGAWLSMRRETLRLERPGAPLLHRHRNHELGLARAHTCHSADATRGTEPILLCLGDGRTFLAFDDLERARAWAKRVESKLGRRPPWRAYYGEFWPWDAHRFRPGAASAGEPHGFTQMEATFENVLRRERVRTALKGRGR